MSPKEFDEAIKQGGYHARMQDGYEDEIAKLHEVQKAAQTLLQSVYDRFPGEKLRCPHFIALADALKDTDKMFGTEFLDEVLAENKRLREALENINRKASPNPERKNYELSEDLYWCACEARLGLGLKDTYK